MARPFINLLHGKGQMWLCLRNLEGGGGGGMACLSVRSSAK